MNTQEILIAMRELLSEPARWALHFYAYDADGTEVDPNHDSAVCWCVLGAVRKVCGCSDDIRIPLEISEVLGRVIGPRGEPVWNDDAARTHAEVVAAPDKAIALAGLTNMQRLAIACGNDPYTDEQVCERCAGSGTIACGTSFPCSYVAPGPVPEDARGVYETKCDECGGCGHVSAPEISP